MRKTTHFGHSCAKKPMRKGTRHHSGGGNISEMEMAKGKPNGVISGSRKKMPSEDLSSGGAQATRRRSIGDALAVGKSTGGHGKFHEKFAQGGHAVDMGFEKKGDRLKIARKRAGILEEPAFKKGGHIHNSMKALYEALHGHFENEPYMKKLKVTSKDVYEGEPHHGVKKMTRRATGGHMWIQDAIKPSNKGALHKTLGVPKGEKISTSKLENAERSRSPLLSKRAHLAETLRKFHR